MNKSDRLMYCPKCGQEMGKYSVENVIYDFCFQGCQGVWCDKGELAEYVESINELPKLGASKEETSPLKCPNCDCHMLRRPYLTRETIIDYCPDCLGVFLDANELGSIHREAIKMDKNSRLASIFKKLRSKLWD